MATAPGSLGMARAYVMGDVQVTGIHPGNPYDLLAALDQITWRRPPLEIPRETHFEELLTTSYSDLEEHAYHAIELLQSMAERRRGGETGVRSVQTIEGDAVWSAGWSKELLSAALSRSDTPLGLTVKDGRTQDLVATGELQRLVSKPAAYLIEYRDGLNATMLNLRGAVQDFNFAAKVKGHGVISTQFLLTPEPNVTYSACLMNKAAEMFATGRAPYPIERTLLTSGVTEACHRSQGKRLDTPKLAVAYQPPNESQHCRT